MTYKDIPGWFTFEDVYSAAVERASHGDIFVEIGPFLGMSTAFLARAIKDSGKQITLFAVDTFEGTPEADPDSQLSLAPWIARYGGNLFGVFKRNMEACGVDEIVRTICELSVKASARFRDGSVAFVYLDGAHDWGSVTADIQAWTPKLKPGGVLAGHDYNWPGVRKAVHDCLGIDGFNLVGDYLSWVRK